MQNSTKIQYEGFDVKPVIERFNLVMKGINPEKAFYDIIVNETQKIKQTTAGKRLLSITPTKFLIKSKHIVFEYDLALNLVKIIRFEGSFFQKIKTDLNGKKAFHVYLLMDSFYEILKSKLPKFKKPKPKQTGVFSRIGKYFFPQDNEKIEFTLKNGEKRIGMFSSGENVFCVGFEDSVKEFYFSYQVLTWKSLN
jgi:hypothetical protein